MTPINIPSKRCTSEVIDLCSAQAPNMKRRKLELDAFLIAPFSEELIVKICTYMQLGTLAAFAQVSKRSLQLSESAPLWRKICRKAKVKIGNYPRCDFLRDIEGNNSRAQYICAKLLSENIYLSPKPELAHHYIQLALSDRMLSECVKMKIKVEKARLEINFNMGGDSLKRFFFLSDVISSSLANAKTKASAKFLQAKMRCVFGIDTLSDNRADKILREVALNQYARQSDKTEAAYLVAILRAKKRIDSLNDNQAEQLLQDVSQNLSVNPFIRTQADFWRALLRVEKRAVRLSDDQADELLEEVGQSQTINVFTRIRANLYRAYLRVEGRTDRLSDNSADQLLLAVSRDQNANAKLRAKADYLRIRLWYNKRTNSLSYNQAVEMLLNIIQNGRAHLAIREKANLYLASLRYDRQAESISDECFNQQLKGLSRGKSDLQEGHNCADESGSGIE